MQRYAKLIKGQNKTERYSIIYGLIYKWSSVSQLDIFFLTQINKV